MTERKKSHQEEYAEKMAKELIERLKQGTAPFQLLWQPDMGRDFPFNPPHNRKCFMGDSCIKNI